MIDERVLAERLIAYDTSRPEELVAAAGFVKGWLESRDIEVQRSRSQRAARCWWPRSARATRDAPCVVLHGHLDVVPGPSRAVRAAGRGRPADRPRRLRHEGRPGGDDVRAQGRRGPGPGPGAAGVRPRRGVRGARRALHRRRRRRAGSGGDFAITGEPTDMHIGVEAKGVLVMRIVVHGRAAHSSTPWLGDNAVLKAIDVFRAIESLPFSRESSEMFDRPSINLGRIEGGDALNKVPDRCEMAVDVRYLPGPGPGGDPRPGAGDPRHRRRRARSSIRRSPCRRTTRTCGRCARRWRARARTRDDERRPRRRLRRRLVHRGGDPGGRVRARGRRPPRARRVGVAVLAGALPPRAGRLRARAAGAGSEPAPSAGRRADARSRAAWREADPQHPRAARCGASSSPR